MLALKARILMRADVPPRPAVESAFLHVRDVVGDEVVAEGIALIHRAPQLSRTRIHRDPASGITNAVGINAQHAVLWIAYKNVGAVFLAGMSIGIVHVRSRAHRDKHSLAILRKSHGARPV